MEDLKQRLIDFARVRYDMGQTRFEDLCGLGHGTISAIKSNGPSASVIIRIAQTCPELNLNWLFRGEGQMTLDAPAPPSSPAVQIGSIQTVNIGNWGELIELRKDKMQHE